MSFRVVSCRFVSFSCRFFRSFCGRFFPAPKLLKTKRKTPRPPAQATTTMSKAFLINVATGTKELEIEEGSIVLGRTDESKHSVASVIKGVCTDKAFIAVFSV